MAKRKTQEKAIGNKKSLDLKVSVRLRLLFHHWAYNLGLSTWQWESEGCFGDSEFFVASKSANLVAWVVVSLKQQG